MTYQHVSVEADQSQSIDAEHEDEHGNESNDDTSGSRDSTSAPVDDEISGDRGIDERDKQIRRAEIEHEEVGGRSESPTAEDHHPEPHVPN